LSYQLGRFGSTSINRALNSHIIIKKFS